METGNTLTFDQLPGIVQSLRDEVARLTQVVTDSVKPPKNMVRFTEEEAATYLHLSVETLKSKARAGAIPSCKNGQKRFYYEDMLQEWERKSANKKHK